MPTPRQPTSRPARLALAALALAALAGLVPGSHARARDYDVDAETGYRMERYRAPVPDSVPGGATLDTAALRERLAAEPALVLVDVFPPEGLGADPPDGSWVISEAHATLPGATWLPEVGRGYLTPEHERYFRRNLERLSGGDLATPLAFFCTASPEVSVNGSVNGTRHGSGDGGGDPVGGASGERELASRASGETESDFASEAAEAAGRRGDVEGEQAIERWLDRIAHDPRRFLERCIALELRRRRAAGQSAPEGGSVW